MLLEFQIAFLFDVCVGIVVPSSASDGSGQLRLWGFGVPNIFNFEVALDV